MHLTTINTKRDRKGTGESEAIKQMFEYISLSTMPTMSHQHMKNEQEKGEKGLSKSLNSLNLFHKYIKKEKVTNLTTNNLPTLKSNTMKNWYKVI